jgi:CRISPR-associated endoribonuclease Cas6
MRLKITFQLPGPRQVLPLNYQYPLSAWIYKTLAQSNEELARRLHESGFRLENQKTFKLFTFSNFNFPHGTWKIIKGSDRMELFSHEATLIIAFQIPEILNNFVAGLFNNQETIIGDKISQVIMQVINVEVLQEPQPDDMAIISALSPIVVSKKSDGMEQEKYLKPGEEDFELLFFKNLIDKHNAYRISTGRPPAAFRPEAMKFESLTRNPKSRLQLIKAFTDKPIKVRGYFYKFRIEAPSELIQTGLDSGFGAMNAMGFGCCQIMNLNI